MIKLKIYVAGPYSPRDEDYFHTVIQKASQNVDRAIQRGIELIEKGHKPFIPHLTHFVHTHRDAKDYGDWWYEYDNTFLKDWADAVFMMEGWENSKGATAEKGLAEQLDLEIFYNMKDIPEEG